MKFPRRQFLYLALGAAALPAFAWVASGQTYPSRRPGHGSLTHSLRSRPSCSIRASATYRGSLHNPVASANSAPDSPSLGAALSASRILSSCAAVTAWLLIYGLIATLTREEVDCYSADGN